MLEFDFVKVNNVLKLKYDYFQTEFDKIKNGTSLKIIIKNISEKRERSNEQLNLYWAACQLFVENSDENWNSKEKVDEQCKIALRFIDFYIIKDNISYVKTKSVSFDNLKHLDACDYFDRAFEWFAQQFEVTKEEFIKVVKDKLKKNESIE